MDTAAPSTPAAPAAPAAATTPTTDPKAAGAAAKPPDVPKHKVKIDGAESEVTLDELIRGYQTDQTGQKRLKEAADKEKALGVEREKLGKAVAAAKAGNYEALRELGLDDNDIEKLSVAVLSKKQQAVLEEERRKALDPDKRELEDLRKFKEEQAAKEKETATKAEQEAVTKASGELRGHVMDTLDLLPKEMRSEIFAHRALDAWEYATEHADEIQKRGIKVDAQYIAGKVRAEALGHYRNLLTNAKDDELDALIPPEVAERIRKRGSTPPPPPPNHPALGASPQVRNEQKPETPKPRKSEAEIIRSVTRAF